MFYETIYIPENKPNNEDLINSWVLSGIVCIMDLTRNMVINVNNNTPELGIAVTDVARGMGVGTLLMKETIHQAICDGHNSISLSVYPANSTAVHIYKKWGFEDYGVSGTSITMAYSVREQ